MSGLLFVIGIEVLANAIRNKNTINGIKVGEVEIKASLYADDTKAIVRDLESIPELMVLINNFKNTSGLETGTLLKQKGCRLAIGKTTLKFLSVFAGDETQ